MSSTSVVRAVSSSSAKLAVTSTLDGLAALPERIHWQAFPQPSGNIREVDYVIDGKQLWVEHNTPYYYGDDGNYLVTTFLAAGSHTFTVRALDTSGNVATDTVTATVPIAALPPASLAGTWTGYAGHVSGSPPAGYWRLVISQIGWQVYDTAGGGGLYDVAYLSPGVAEIRNGMATGHPGTDGNAWCNHAPGDQPAGRPPVYVRWTVQGRLLAIRPIGDDSGSCGFTTFLRAVTWTKTGS